MQDDHALIARPPVHLSVQDLANQRVREIKARLDTARMRTRHSVRELKREVIEQVDWRRQFRARPAPFLVGAFFLGFLLARNR